MCVWLRWGRGGKVGGGSSSSSSNNNIIGSCMDRCEVSVCVCG